MEVNMSEQEIRKILEDNNQYLLLKHLDNLSEDKRSILIANLKKLDISSFFNIVKGTKDQKKFQYSEIKPAEVLENSKVDESLFRSYGEKALKNGEVAFFMVAGGQGSRLGFEHPKGMFPISPVCSKTLFQMHCEKIHASGKYYGFTPRLFIMTSSSNHDETVKFFNENGRDWLNLNDIYFFKQRDLPAIDMNGNLILIGETSLFTAPDGHGGALLALKENNMTSIMHKLGIKYLSYFQVDNPLVKLADPVFLGLHIFNNADISSKVLAKRDASEKVGVAAIADGKPCIIEYSDLPYELAIKKDDDGKLLFNYGSIAIHIFSVDFIDRITTDALHLPYHIAKKKIPYFSPDTGYLINPETLNGIKFEQFIFDSIPLANKTVFYETLRDDEFAPLKNKEGDDSIKTCKDGISLFYKNWFKKAEIKFDNYEQATVEVSSLFAIEYEQFKNKIENYINKVPIRLYIE